MSPTGMALAFFPAIGTGCDFSFTCLTRLAQKVARDAERARRAVHGRTVGLVTRRGANVSRRRMAPGPRPERPRIDASDSITRERHQSPAGSIGGSTQPSDQRREFTRSVLLGLYGVSETYSRSRGRAGRTWGQPALAREVCLMASWHWRWPPSLTACLTAHYVTGCLARPEVLVKERRETWCGHKISLTTRRSRRWVVSSTGLSGRTGCLEAAEALLLRARARAA